MAVVADLVLMLLMHLHPAEAMTSITLQHATWSLDTTMPLGTPGGFGAVYRGSSASGTPVAIKRLHISSEEASHRELRIARDLEGIEHDHVVHIFDSGCHEGHYYIVMELADDSLHGHINSNGRLDASETTSILIDIARGLREVSHLIHRDLKPRNVLRVNGKWKICDFGISRFIEDATSTRTLRDNQTDWYAAPEQWRDERCTHATDIYALGCTGFCALTGKPPFPSTQRSEVRDGHLYRPPPSLPSSSPMLKAIVLDMLAKHPRARPSLDAVLQRLEAIRTTMQGLSASDSVAQANLAVATATAQAEAEAARLRHFREQRRVLAQDAFESLGRIQDSLITNITDSASHARVSNSKSIQLGSGQLELTRCFKSFGSSPFRQSGWDVVCGACMSLLQSNKKVRSANLWFADIDKSGTYRWWEVAYWFVGAAAPHAPFGVTSERDLELADMAASSITSAAQHAHRPIAIDSHDADAFIQRWRTHLAVAAQNAYRAPTRLPED